MATNQLVHACGGNPVPFSKFPGQVLQVVDYEKVTLELGDFEVVFSTDLGACAGAFDAQPGWGHTDPSKALPSKGEPLLRVDSESSGSSGPPVGRRRRCIPKLWKAKAVRTDLEYSHGATSDVHTINPVHDGVIDVSDDLVRPMLVAKSVGGIGTIPFNGPLVESKNVFEVHNTGTRTESLVFHRLQEEFEKNDAELNIGQGDVVDEKITVQDEIIEPSVSSDEERDHGVGGGSLC